MIKKIREFFKQECPLCGGEMGVVFIDMVFDRAVYKCKKCGKEWI